MRCARRCLLLVLGVIHGWVATAEVGWDPQATVAAVLAQDGRGLPQDWGTHEAWKAPAWYGIQLPGLAPAAASNVVARALAALPHVRIELPSDALFGATNGLYTHPTETGDAWERRARLFFDGGPGGLVFGADAGLRIQGGWNRMPKESPKHSFRVVFRARYGTAKLKQRVFGRGSASIDQIVLRSGNNHSWLHWDAAERRTADYLRDPWMRATHAAMGHPAARSRPVHLFLNGLYWGVYDLCERPDAHFAAQAWGGKEDDYDARNADKVLSGDGKAWDELMARVNAGVTTEEDYEAVGRLLDIPAFIDFMLVNLYGANADWDRSSNWYAARRRSPAGRWRFIVWDGERTLESPGDNRLDADDDQSPTRIFQRLRGSSRFREEFGRRAAQHLGPGGALDAFQAGERYRALADVLRPAMPAEAARWGSYRRDVHPYKEGPFEAYTAMGHWEPEVARLLTGYFPARTTSFAAQLRTAGLLTP